MFQTNSEKEVQQEETADADVQMQEVQKEETANIEVQMQESQTKSKNRRNNEDLNQPQHKQNPRWKWKCNKEEMQIAKEEKTKTKCAKTKYHKRIH